MAAAGKIPIINGSDRVVAMAHEAIDRAFASRVTELWSVLMRDARAHHNQVSEHAKARFNTGYRLAVIGWREAHNLIDEFQQEGK
jgi:hypothetical protein